METELKLSDTDPTQNLTATQFASIFSEDRRWIGVNKLFVIDTCFASGFWANLSGTVKYLSSLDHASIIAASPENLMSHCHKGINGAGGLLGQALATALASLNGKDITLATLGQQVRVGEEGKIVYEASNGWSYEFVSPIDGIADIPDTTPSVTLQTYATSDFSLGLAGAEPCSVEGDFNNDGVVN